MRRQLSLFLAALFTLLLGCSTPPEEVQAPGGGFAFAVVCAQFSRSASREEVIALDRVLRAREQIGTITRDEGGKSIKILYVEPRVIDFPALAADSKKLGLEVTGFRLRASGTITEHYCDACLAKRRFLRLDATGQEFELESAKSQVGERVLMAGEVQRWTSGRHLRIQAFGETKENR